ncbi:hypothetical protein CQ057_12970 [Ochrobactrum sp. MYb49]|nr:hypothetical protein CQ057_12970 [Ochrobactrum sp. MYb49]
MHLSGPIFCLTERVMAYAKAADRLPKNTFGTGMSAPVLAMSSGKNEELIKLAASEHQKLQLLKRQNDDDAIPSNLFAVNQ